MKYNVLDLFCGAGGLSLGFKMAGFDIVGGIDFNQEAIDTHALNFKDGFHFCGDISTLTDEFILEKFEGRVDVIIGGPPCQGFSTANMQQKDIESDDRNKLFYQFIRFVRLLKPKSFVMENVRGILTKDNGHVKDVMMKVMDELGYNVDVRVLAASDYGVPQKRMRAFFVGTSKTLEESFNFDDIQKKTMVTVKDAIGDLYDLDNKTKLSTVDDEFNLDIEPSCEYQELMRKDSEGILYNHNIKYPKEIVQTRMSYVPEGGNWKNVPDELWDTIRTNRHSSAYRRLDSKDVSITIDTGHMNYFHPKYNRVPTVRESARIQSFPDDFIFTGGQGAQFRQVGNAVPPLLSKAIAETLKTYLDRNTSGRVKLMSYKTIDLFCGAGGFSLGFEMAGFETTLAIDKWKDAINTFNYNREHKVGQYIDIQEFDNERLKAFISENNIAGIIGGPPCQGFSMVGTRDEADDRNSLYLQYVRFVEVVKPKFFILENVKGLLTLKNGFFKEDIIRRFTGLGYNVDFKLLKASDYGVAQNRERVFFVGLRKDIFGDKFFEFPKGSESNAVSTSEALSDLPSLDNGENHEIYATLPQNKYQHLMREGSELIYNNEGTKHTEQTKNIISMVPDGGTIKDLPEEYYSVRNYNSAFKRMNSQKPSTTIDCGHRNYFHYKENRVPTVRESARIQSFPDRYFFTGSKTSQYTQVGNAVPALLANKIAIEIKKLLDEIEN